MKDFYGDFKQNIILDDIDVYVEEILYNGFSIVEGVLDSALLEKLRISIDEMYKSQEESFGKDSLDKIKELDMLRSPLLYDDLFLDLAKNNLVNSVVKKILGEWYVLNLQNSIINRPNKKHHQTSWHRDIPYFDRIAHHPFAINALYAIDPFTVETGATYVLPFSHKQPLIPSDQFLAKHKIPAIANPGSVILFDSMLFHCAGYNSSNITRRAVNHLYSLPLIKQQYDFSESIEYARSKQFDEFTLKLLGYYSKTPKDDKEWRLQRMKKFGLQ